MKIVKGTLQDENSKRDFKKNNHKNFMGDLCLLQSDWLAADGGSYDFERLRSDFKVHYAE